MEQTFLKAYGRLNDAQKQAVDTTEGPVLVIAGPGTGKTQLLSLRIANILRTTDTLPENILCLTFTDSAAHTMRERLTSIIGKAAYDVTISTYHAFGSDLLRRYPEYFTDSNDLKPADDLTIDGIFRDIQATLPYTNPLKFETFLRDVKQLVSDSKRALLAPADLRSVARSNQQFINGASKLVQAHLQTMVRIDKQAGALFTALSTDTKRLKATAPLPGIVVLSDLWQQELETALELFYESGKTTSLTKWKNNWLAKDADSHWVVDGSEQNTRLLAGADIYELYTQALEKAGLYDYDDMILRAIKGLEQHPDLKFTLQERYLYVMLDEFQDTNHAQSRIVELLTDNPASEQRPNVLAVGDDDQAIYAFQGANYSHMLSFYERYRDVLVVTLTENYRSHTDILETASGVAEQIQTRLHHNFPAVTKHIVAANNDLPETAIVERHEFKSALSQNTWVAKQIKQLLEQGIKASDIAVLAPKHEHLESLVAYMQHEMIPLHYEKRENILEDPAIAELLTMSRLVLALMSADHSLAASLWPQVISYSFWQLPTSLIWQLSWQANDAKLDWTQVLGEHTDTKAIALFFIRLSQLAVSQSLEQMFDHLIGTTTVELQEATMKVYRSPFYEHYFGELTAENADTHSFWQLLSNLTVLRERLREYRAAESTPLRLADFVDYVEAHQAANIKILNTNPYQEASDAVELMTAYKAKGQEYSAVFILAAIDEVWGTKARALSSRLSLAPNLQFIRYAGTTEDERLRLLYVALTRAKTHLYLTSYANTYSGRQTTHLKYLDEHADETSNIVSPLLPAGRQVVHIEDDISPELDELRVYWQQQHYQAVTSPTLKNLLQARLETFQLSPTQYNSFIDVAHDGPSSFFLQTLLRFPAAPGLSLQYGNAIHETLEWIHYATKQDGKLPTEAQVKVAYTKRLQAMRIGEPQESLLLERGLRVLKIYLVQRAHTVATDNYVEYNFRNENVFIGEAHLSGKIDKLIVDPKAKTITIVDYKTGKSHAKWEREPKLHFYRNQLYFYKFLVEHSRTFQGYHVIDAYLEFVEPDEQGIIRELHIEFEDAVASKLQQLIEKAWQHIMDLHFPDVAHYSQDLRGIESFETDLLSDEV